MAKILPKYVFVFQFISLYVVDGFDYLVKYYGSGVANGDEQLRIDLRTFIA